ncbi:hypothetical protein V6N13_039357 [Hibiscus sabdariffa]|uniref:Yippee domain-containing protein n=1 Tax=Hibiscus sabdariffa TaxID=183260 RepID=A0ABR2SWK1_9ROSI
MAAAAAAARDRVRYPVNAASKFFLCSQCRNHLFPHADFSGQSPSWPGVSQGVVCRAAVNVREDDTPRLLHHCRVVNVHCDQCDRHIGERFTEPANVTGLHELQGNCYLFHNDKLLYWDGSSLRSSTGEQIIIHENGYQGAAHGDL